MLPFTRDQSLQVFSAYNQEVWPAQPVAYAVGLATLVALFSANRSVHRIAGLGLSAMWLWTGFFYHWIFFAPINGAARLFGLLFLFQGAALIWLATRPSPLLFAKKGTGAGAAGSALILYSLLLYPLVGRLRGHDWGSLPAFGITPCPVTLFTLGMLLFARPPWFLWGPPLIWALIGGSAALNLGMVADWPLLLSGPAVLTILLLSGRQANRPAPTLR